MAATWPTTASAELRPAHPPAEDQRVVDGVVDRAEEVPALAQRIGQQRVEVLPLGQQEREVVGEEPAHGERARARGRTAR